MSHLDSSTSQLLAEGITATSGDFVVVPAHTMHAFCTPDHAGVDMLFLMPGAERFEYFRLADRVRRGEASPQEILATQDVCDNYFEPSEDLIQRIVPDGCVDLIWFADRELLIEGPDTGPRLVPLPGLVRVSGIRLRPGAAAAVLGIPMSELRDHAAPVPVSLVWGEQGRRLEEALANAAPDLRLGLLAEAVAKRGAEPDTLVRATA
ncbi:MAG: hypothetical protein JO318_17175, partial [Chloroflexi bacterium]|nr:hypothetical protein [Chloroflexota bacterium]